MTTNHLVAYTYNSNTIQEFWWQHEQQSWRLAEDKLKTISFSCRQIEWNTVALVKFRVNESDTVLHNGATTFTRMCYACPNSIITHLLCVIILFGCFLNVFKTV